LNKDGIFNRMWAFNDTMRDIMRCCRSKMCDDETIILEVLWRAVIQTIDSLIRIHEYNMDILVESVKRKIKSIIAQKDEQIENW
jgi:hypothetical protein